MDRIVLSRIVVPGYKVASCKEHAPEKHSGRTTVDNFLFISNFLVKENHRKGLLGNSITVDSETVHLQNVSLEDLSRVKAFPITKKDILDVRTGT